MVRGNGEKVMGIDSPYGGPLAYANTVGLSLEILWTEFRGPKLGLFCGLSLYCSGYRRLKFKAFSFIPPDQLKLEVRNFYGS